jgi:hypothetical protein
MNNYADTLDTDKVIDADKAMDTKNAIAINTNNAMGRNSIIYSRKDAVFALAMLACGFLYWNLIRLPGLGAGVTLFAAVFCLCTFIYLKSGEVLPISGRPDKNQGKFVSNPARLSESPVRFPGKEQACCVSWPLSCPPWPFCCSTTS